MTKLRIISAIALLVWLLPAVRVMAQQRPFTGRLAGSAHSVSLTINLYDQDVLVPGGEMFGEVAGYLGDSLDSRKWIIVGVEIKKPTEALLTIVNDYGSEDLTATLTALPDGTYRLRQETGSSIKVVRGRKFVKLPSTIVFRRRETLGFVY